MAVGLFLVARIPFLLDPQPPVVGPARGAGMLPAGGDLPIVQVQFGFIGSLHPHQASSSLDLLLRLPLHHVLHTRPDLCRPAFTVTASIDAGGHTRDNRHKIIHHLVSSVAWIDHLYPSTLLLQEGRDVGIAKTGQPVPMLHHHHTDAAGP